MDTVFTYDVPHLAYWDWRIAADLFCGGIGVGAYLVAVLNSLYYKDRYPVVSKVGAVLSPVFVTVGLVFLLTELGHPLRLHHTVTGFNVHSPLSWGGPFQGMFIMAGAVYAWLWLRGASRKARTVVGLAGLPLALIVGAYHGWLLTILRARPLWNTGPAMVAALVAFVTTGMAAVLLVLCFLPRRSPGSTAGRWMIRDFRHLLIAALAVQGLTFFVWWISLYYGPADAQAALAAANAECGPMFWFVGIGLGLVAPILLQLVEVRRHAGRPDRLDLPLTVLTSVLILVGGFVFRWAVVIGGQVR